jgi:hypothetical protein
MVVPRSNTSLTLTATNPLTIDNRTFTSAQEYINYLRTLAPPSRLTSLTQFQRSIQGAMDRMGDIADEVWTYVENDAGIATFIQGRQAQFNLDFSLLQNAVITRREARNRQTEGRRRLLEVVNSDFLDILVPALTNNSTGILDGLRSTIRNSNLDPLTVIQRASLIRLHRLARLGGFGMGYARRNPEIESGDISHVIGYPFLQGDPNWQPHINAAIQEAGLVQIPGNLYVRASQVPPNLRNALTGNGRPWDPNARVGSIAGPIPSTPARLQPALSPRVQTIQSTRGATGQGSASPLAGRGGSRQGSASPMALDPDTALPSVERSSRPNLRPNAGLPPGGYRIPPAPRPARGPAVQQPATPTQQGSSVAGQRRPRESDSPSPGPQGQGQRQGQGQPGSN